VTAAARRRLGPAAVAAAVFAAAVAAAPAPAPCETIVRQHLDAGRVQFSGMDINGDAIGDSIRLDRIKQAIVYFVGDSRKNLSSFDPATLPEQDRRFVPDALIEKDLDGDSVEDLLLFNRAYLSKYADNEQTFTRILAGSIYIGQPRGTYAPFASAALTEESSALILQRARGLVLAGP
jgi:hypothetical protein